MGASQKVINWSKRRSYKITIAALVGIGLLFILIGAIMSITSSTVAATGIFINGTRIQNNSILNMTIYPVNSDNAREINHEHSFQISTTPGNQITQPITITPGPTAAGILTVTPQIRTGEVATITILRQGNGLPRFHQENNPEDFETIFVTAGDNTIIIRVFIRFYQGMATISSTLQEQEGISWRNIDELNLSQFRTNPSRFRVNINYSILGQQRAPTEVTAQETTPGQTISSEITVIPLNVPQHIILGGTFEFTLSANFQGTQIVFVFRLVVI